jgi:RES domain-containing protein
MNHKDSPRLKIQLQKLLPSAICLSRIGYRSVSTPYANLKDLLTGIGSKKSGGRWNPLGIFPAVYLALELETAFKESFAHISYYGFEPYEALPRTFVAVSFQLHRILDLEDPRILNHLKISRRSLLSLDWRKVQDAGHEALTQAIGRIAWELGYEGIVAPAAAAPGGRNLVYFPNALLSESKAEILRPEDLRTRD